MTSAFLTLRKGQDHTTRSNVTDVEVSAFSECFLLNYVFMSPFLNLFPVLIIELLYLKTVLKTDSPCIPLSPSVLIPSFPFTFSFLLKANVKNLTQFSNEHTQEGCVALLATFNAKANGSAVVKLF